MIEEKPLRTNSTVGNELSKLVVRSALVVIKALAHSGELLDTVDSFPEAEVRLVP